jgi:hypothetical protein
MVAITPCAKEGKQAQENSRRLWIAAVFLDVRARNLVTQEFSKACECSIQT